MSSAVWWRRWVAAACAVALAAAVGAAAAALLQDRPGGCGAGAAWPARPLPVQPASAGRQVTPEGFGATGDGATDDGPALQRALDALEQGDTLALTAGSVYRHGAVLHVRRPGVRVTGAAVLDATDEEASALSVEADGVVLDGGLVLRTSTTTRRWSTLDQHRLLVRNSSGLRVRDVAVQGSAAAGVFVTGSSDVVLERLRVEDTRADGVHLTGGSQRVAVRDVVVRRSGDDGVAVVSYQGDGSVTRDVRVERADVAEQRGGRGISVVGGVGIAYCDVAVRGSWGAAVYVASEGEPFFSRAVDRVVVDGARLSGSNTSPEVDHGAVLVFSGGPPVTRVRLSDLHVDGTRTGASRQVGLLGAEGELQDVLVERVRIRGGGSPFSATVPPTSYRTREWTVDGSAHDPERP